MAKITAAKGKPAAGKAKAKPAATDKVAPYDDAADRRKYEVQDALRTLTKSEEIRGDNDLMREVSAHAQEQAELASKAAELSKRGLISDKQGAKLKAKADGDAAKESDGAPK